MSHRACLCLASLVFISGLSLASGCGVPVDGEAVGSSSPIQKLNYIAYLGSEWELNVAFTLVDEKDRTQVCRGIVDVKLWHGETAGGGDLIQEWHIPVAEDDYAEDGVVFLTLGYKKFKATAKDSGYLEIAFRGDGVTKSAAGATPLIIDPGCCPNIHP